LLGYFDRLYAFPASLTQVVHFLRGLAFLIAFAVVMIFLPMEAILLLFFALPVDFFTVLRFFVAIFLIV
jgi:hypothetical protein